MENGRAYGSGGGTLVDEEVVPTTVLVEARAKKPDRQRRTWNDGW